MVDDEYVYFSKSDVTGVLRREVVKSTALVAAPVASSGKAGKKWLTKKKAVALGAGGVVAAGGAGAYTASRRKRESE